MAIITTDRKFFSNNSGVVGYTLSAHHDGVSQEVRNVRVDAITELRSLVWSLDANGGHLSVFWEGNTPAEDTLIAYLNTPNGEFCFESMGVKMKRPTNSTGRIITSTENFGNQDTYTLVIKGKE